MSDSLFEKNLHMTSGFKTIPADWRPTSVVDHCILGRGRVISQEEIDRHPGPYPVYSSQTSNDGEMGQIDTFDFDGEWITWTTDGANAGTVFYRNGRFNCTNVCGTLRSKPCDSLDLRFFHYHLGRIAKNYVSYIGNPKLMNDVMASVAFPLPSFLEQRKIARILTTLDNLIEKTESLIAKYQAIKQGMMHDLFTRGVDAHGHLRPPQTEAPELYKQSELGWIPTGWKLSSIGSACTWMSGGTPSKSIPSFWNGEVPWVSPKDMKRFEINDSEDHISREAARAGTRMVPAGTVLIVIRGMILAHSFPVCLTTGEVTFNQDIKALAFNGTVQGRFLAYWLVAHASQMVALATESTHGTKRFDMDDLQAVQFGLPSPDEQQRVVSRLDSVVWSHQAEQEQLRKLTKIKAGLMQDLLSGKVRVKVDEPDETSADV